MLNLLSTASLLVAAGSFALWPGFPAEIEVRGARPAREVQAALKTLTPSLAGCVVSAGAPAVLVVDLELLAAGFVDRVTVLHRNDTDAAIDLDCARATLRALPLRDRGREPVSHAIIRLVTTPAGLPPPPGTSPADIARALEVKRDELRRCIEDARKSAPELAGTVVVRLTVKSNGDIADVDAHEGTLPSPAVRGCIAREVGLAHFPDGRAAGRDTDERVAWPLHFDKPPPSASKGDERVWDAPTFLEFLGCGALF